MTMDELLTEQRAIWGREAMSPDYALVVLAKVVGDLAGLARKLDEHRWTPEDHYEWDKELGNLICTATRLVGDHGTHPDQAVAAALDAQAEYAARLREARS